MAQQEGYQCQDTLDGSQHASKSGECNDPQHDHASIQPAMAAGTCGPNTLLNHAEPSQQGSSTHEQDPEQDVIPGTAGATWVQQGLSASSWNSSRGSNKNPGPRPLQHCPAQGGEGAEAPQQQRVNGHNGTGSSQPSSSHGTHHTAGRIASTPRCQACSTAAEPQQQQLLAGYCGRPGTSNSSRSIGSSTGSVAPCVPGPPVHHSLEGALASGGGKGAVHRPSTSAAAPAAPSPLRGPQRRTTGGSSAASCACSLPVVAPQRQLWSGGIPALAAGGLATAAA
jgi:hypothetical protein